MTASLWRARPETRLLVLAAHLAPELCPSSHPLDTEGAGKTGRWPRPWPACRKKAGGSHHRSGRTRPAFPARLVLTAYTCSPRGPALLPPSPARSSLRETWHQHRDARTTRFRRPRQPVRRRSENSAAHRRVHRIPLPTSVTIAIRPSGGTERAHHKSDLGSARSNLCFSEGIDRFCESNSICPTGSWPVQIGRFAISL